VYCSRLRNRHRPHYGECTSGKPHANACFQRLTIAGRSLPCARAVLQVARLSLPSTSADSPCRHPPTRTSRPARQTQIWRPRSPA
jgi:hypothetical protein